MNKEHLQKIFENYIDRFEEFNNEDRKKISEYYKWEIASQFKEEMDKALKSAKEDFWKELYNVEQISRDLIDNYVQPFYGLVQFAKKEPETVREMFQKLYAKDDGDLNTRQRKIEEFLEESYRLRNQYTSNSYLYKNSFHSITTYLSLYDPEHNYIYKPTAAKRFARYIDYGDDFGSGDHVKLKNYYRMCNQLVDEIKEYTRLEELDNIRLKLLMKHPKGLENIYKDENKHILAYDIIYCAYKYNLFDGITLTHFTAQELKEQKLLVEKQQKAQELFEKLKAAQEDKKTLDAAITDLEKWFDVGKFITYKSFGKCAKVENGTIVKKGFDSVTIDFGEGTTKTIGTIASVVNGFVRPKDVDNVDFANVVEILKKASQIKSNLSMAEREFAPYSEYI